MSTTTKEPDKDIETGNFQIGRDDVKGEVVFNFDAKMVSQWSPEIGGHITFTPSQAAEVVNLIMKFGKLMICQYCNYSFDPDVAKSLMFCSPEHHEAYYKD